jgi:hypothetical protein
LFKLRNINIPLYDIILVVETGYPVQLLQYLRGRNHSCKIIYWLWNTIGKTPKPLFFDPKEELEKLIRNSSVFNYDIVSFDKADCEKYGFIFNAQCAPRISLKNTDKIIKQDIFFIGVDKDRLPQLKKLGELFQKMHLSYKFIIFPDINKHYDSQDEKILYHGTPLLYKDVVEEDLYSKAILDIVQENQAGLTWRPIESLFYHKKLITNYKNIKSYDFYNPINIFILGIDDPRNLREFIFSSFQPVDENIVNKYTLMGSIEVLSKD